MVRYDDYKPRAEAANGYGGRKIAYVDEIRWIPMPEVATRVASLESGEVDFADDLQAVAYDRLKDNPKVRPLIVRPYAWGMGVFNKKEGLMTNGSSARRCRRPSTSSRSCAPRWGTHSSTGSTRG